MEAPGGRCRKPRGRPQVHPHPSEMSVVTGSAEASWPFGSRSVFTRAEGSLQAGVLAWLTEDPTQNGCPGGSTCEPCICSLPARGSAGIGVGAGWVLSRAAERGTARGGRAQERQDVVWEKASERAAHFSLRGPLPQLRSPPGQDRMGCTGCGEPCCGWGVLPWEAQTPESQGRGRSGCLQSGAGSLGGRAEGVEGRVATSP